MRILRLWLVSFVLALNSTSLFAAPQSGWWWNADESGRGFFIEMVGDWMFFSGYFYADDGRATWLVSNDPMPNPTYYQGRLLALSGGQALVGEYRAPGAPTVPGNVSIVFTDDTHAVMTWPGGTVPIERQPLSSAIAAFQPQTGWWWNPAESGRGFSIELQGQHMFLGAYMYDAAGNPIWYVADAMMTTATRFSAPLLQFAHGQTLTGSYRHPDAPLVVGTITLDFTGVDQAQVTLSDLPPAPGLAAAKQFKSFPVETQKKKPVVPAVPPVDRPYYLDGHFRQQVTFDSNAVLVVDGLMTWRQDLIQPLNGSTVYEIQVGSAIVDIKGSIDQGDEVCPVAAKSEYQLQNADGKLTVEPSGRYSGTIKFNTTVPTLPCGKNYDFPVPFTMSLSGIMSGVDLAGSPPAFGSGPVIKNEWSFFGRN